MDDSKKQLKEMLLSLGFTDENADIISDKLIISILEDIYYNMLPQDQIDNLKVYIDKGAIEQIQSIASKLDPTLFAQNFEKSTQKVVENFLKQIIQKCPPELLDDLQTKIEDAQVTFSQKQM